MKTVKRLAAVLILGLMIMSLSSCKQLDEVKERSAYWADDSGEVISWLEKNYVMTSLNPDELEIRLYGPQIYVNKPDVPVLMNSYEGVPFRADEQKRILYAESDFYLYIYRLSDEDREKIHAGTLYVREDLVEEIEEILKNGKADHYCTEIYLGEGEVTLLLPDDIAEMVDQAMDTGKTVPGTKIMEEDEYTKFFYDYKGSVYIYPCDESMLFRKGYINIYYWEDGEGKEESLIEMDDNGDSVYIADVDPALYKAIRKFYEESLKTK